MAGLNKNFLKLIECNVSIIFQLFSARAPIIHPPDLLGSPSDLKAFHKSLGLPINSGSLFSKKTFFQRNFTH